MAQQDDKKSAGFVRNLITEPGVICFLHTDKPNDGGKFPSSKYEVTFRFDKKDTKTIKLLTDAALKAAKELWGDRIKTIKDVKVGVKDGDEKAHLDGFAGHWYINPRAKKKPIIVGGDRQPLPEGVKLSSNDVCRLCVTAGAFPAAVDKEVAEALKAAGKPIVMDKDENGKDVYCRPAVTFYLNMIQRVKGGAGYGSKADPSAFPEEAGEGAFPAGEGPSDTDAANPFG